MYWQGVSTTKRTERSGKVKGYYTAIGYMGYINGRYTLFATEADYIEAWKEMKGE